MSEPIIIAVISGLLGGGIAGAIGTILVARFSKSKPQQHVDIAKEYLGLVGMTGEQLKEKIEEVSGLTTEMSILARENLKLKGEIEQMKSARAERDEQFDALLAKVSAQEAQLNRDSRDRDELRRKFGELSDRYTILWKYLIEWMEHAIAHNVSPVPPPKELQTDPEIMRILGKKKKE